MTYLLSNICTKNYWNRTTIVEIIVGGWVVSFFVETQRTIDKKCNIYVINLICLLESFISSIHIIYDTDSLI